MAAVESQLAALDVVKLIKRAHSSGGTKNVSIDELLEANNLMVDARMLPLARPFYWSRETSQAVLHLADKVPADAQLNQWNLSTNVVWWHFEEPIPVQTVTDPEPVRAICAGWIDGSFAVICWVGCERPRVAYANAVLDRPREAKAGGLLPSQIFFWKPGETIAELLVRLRREHWMQYGPLGKFRGAEIIGEDKFVEASERISRFVLGALLWLNQKLAPLTIVDGHVERHVRKRYDREVQGDKLDAVRVIELRRREHRHEPASGDESKREWSCRWPVDGHVRNQPVGPGRSERKLIWIESYTKGPDDKPFRARQIVYKVDR